MFWILASALLVFLAVAGWGVAKIYETGRTQHQSALATSVVQTTPTLPATPAVTATMLPTITPTVAVPGDIYVVSSIEENGIFIYGRYRDKAVFTNLNVPTLTLTAHCAIPSWESPEIGHQFVLNSYGVLVPIEGIYSPIQRFWVIQ